MEKEQKERLEQELRFLKESLDADVISRDEYERGRKRIEIKLKEPEREEPVHEGEKTGEEQPEIEIKEIKEKPTKIIGAEEKLEEERKTKDKEEEKQKEIEEEEPAHEEEKETEEEVKVSKKWLYGTAILIIAVILFFSMRGCGNPEGEKGFTPECSLNSDCKQEGMIGACLNPATKEAKCEFKQDIRTELLVINDKSCELCDSSSTKTIVKKIFPNVKIKEIDYGTAEAKNLVDKFLIDALPAYIFDSNVSQTTNFNDFKTALIKKGDNYIMTNTASGAIYYFKRPLIENKLDLYTLPETKGKMESPVQEVLELFNNKLDFTKQVVTGKQKERLEKELAINTYPTFLLNNQLKFRGILPANTIKERICKVNYFEECSKELSKV